MANVVEDKIIEYNTIIHDWMGYKRMEGGFSDWWIGAQKPQDLKYHLSWKWLIPAWSKLYKEIVKIDRSKEQLWNHAANIVDMFGIYVNNDKIIMAFAAMHELLTFYLGKKQKGEI